MRKIIVISFTLCLLTLSACGTTPADTTPITPIETTLAETIPADTTPASTPVTFPPSDTIPLYFKTLKDMDTYMKTGSTDPDDYMQMPGSIVLETYPVDLVKKAGGYLSLSDLFGLDGELTGSIMAMWNKYGIAYGYFFEDIVFSVCPTSAKTVQEHYAGREGNTKNMEIQAIQTFSQLGSVKDGFFSYSVGDFEIVYEVVEGVKISARFIIDDFIVLVSVPDVHSSTLEEDMAKFLSAPGYGNIYGLFSDNEQELSAKINAIKTSVENNGHVAE